MPGTAEHDAIGVLDRMTRVLEAFELDDAGLSISELAARAGLPKSTVSRIAATLVRRGYLERDGRLLRVGVRLFELGHLAPRPRMLREAAMPVLAQVRAATGATVQLVVRDGDESVCIAVLRGRSRVPETARTGARMPLQGTAPGRALLARGEADAIEVGEDRLGTACVAVRIVDAPSGASLGAISISISIPTGAGGFDGSEVARWSTVLRTASDAVARRLAASSTSGSG